MNPTTPSESGGGHAGGSEFKRPLLTVCQKQVDGQTIVAVHAAWTNEKGQPVVAEYQWTGPLPVIIPERPQVLRPMRVVSCRSFSTRPAP